MLGLELRIMVGLWVSVYTVTVPNETMVLLKMKQGILAAILICTLQLIPMFGCERKAPVIWL